MHDAIIYLSYSKKFQILWAWLDEGDFGSYHLVSIIEFSKHVGPTKKFLFGLIFNFCFHHSKLKNLS